MMPRKTSVPEHNTEINKLVYVRRDYGCCYRGWRTELFVKKMTEDGEGKFLFCNYCRGVLRDACLFEQDGKHKVACSLCIPKYVNKQIAQMNRETVNEKQVSLNISQYFILVPLILPGKVIVNIELDQHKYSRTCYNGHSV